MTLEIGIVCGNCDGYSAMGTPHCALCGHGLAMASSGSADANVAAVAAPSANAEPIPSAPPTSPEMTIPEPSPSPPAAEAVVAAVPSMPPSSGPTIARPNLAPRAGHDTVIDSAAPLFTEAMRPRRMTPGAVARVSGEPAAQSSRPSPSQASLQVRNATAQVHGQPQPQPRSSGKSPAATPFNDVESSTSVGPAVPPAADSRPARVPRPSGAGTYSATPGAPGLTGPGQSVRPVTSVRAPPNTSSTSNPAQAAYAQPAQAASAAQHAHHAPSGSLAMPRGAGSSLEELMEQAKNFVCRSCSTPVPVGHKFCGRCGAAVPPDILAARTQFFGQLQAPGKAKLILIRGEGVEGLSYQLNAEQHIVGRNGQLVFPDDPFVSPKHANLFYRNQKLVVRDEGSLNGVFLRVRGGVEIQPADQFLAGEQLFRVDATPKFNDGPAPDGTYFYSSPKHQTPFRVTQVLQGGANGMTVCARQAGIQIGREGGDMNFPGDLYMSASHCKIDEAGGKLTLTDLNSRNGTYVRLKGERELAHGDYLFIGKKLLRVEITAA